MITFKCDRCGYELEVPLDAMSSEIVYEQVHYYIKLPKSEIQFQEFKTLGTSYLLCEDCDKKWATVAQDTINQAALNYIKGGKDNG